MLRPIKIRGYVALPLLFLIVALVRVSPIYASDDKAAVVNSKHDFSLRSGTTIRSTKEERICVFCHTPHTANPSVPLWNHKSDAASSNGVYNSTTLQSVMSQPTASDSSKLCLSCHDGTVALGDTVNDGLAPFVQGSSYRLPISSDSNIDKGNGLSDDHPVAFSPAIGSQIQNPPANDPVKLDAQGKVQCRSCHEPHNEYTDPVTGKFLVKVNSASALCLTCHTQPGWTSASHKLPSNLTNDAKFTSVQGAHTGYTGVSNNGCESCHRPHTAATGQLLLKYQEENVCFKCHDGSVAGYNIQGEFQTKIYRHPVMTTPSVHDESEKPGNATYPLPEISAGVARHAECFDCHNSHAANSTPASAPSVNGALTNVRGITSGGGEIYPAQNQFQVCFKCHADSANKPQYFDSGNTGIGFGRNPVRQTNQGNPNAYNTRTEFTSSVSWHPVVNARGLPAGLNGDITSLRPYVVDGNGSPMTSRPLTSSSLIYCTDCHNSDTGRNLVSQTGSAGPHASNNLHLLERQYSYNIPPVTPGSTMSSTIPFSASAYGICDKCHDLTTLMNGYSFPHNEHVASEGASCAVCHDGHGVNGGNSLSNGHLINFDLSIVGCAGSPCKLQFTSTGPHSGTCTLTCHNYSHASSAYSCGTATPCLP